MGGDGGEKGFGSFFFARHFSRLRHFAWKQCSHNLTSRPVESCHHQCLEADCRLLGFPAGAAGELFDGSLKLWYCTTPFSGRSPPWSIRGVVRVVLGGAAGKSCGHAVVDLSDEGSILVKRVRLTRKTCPRYLVHSRPDPGLPTPKRWIRLHLPESSGFGGLSRRGGGLEPAPGGNRRSCVFSGWSVQPKGAGTEPGFFLSACARAWPDTRVFMLRPHHNHHIHVRTVRTTTTTTTTRTGCVASCVTCVGRTHAGGPWLLVTVLTTAHGVPSVAESDDCARG